MKKVSVVVPCYQMKDEWMERLFHSLEKQSLGIEQLEIVLVVDASPDDTFQRLKAYEEKWEEHVLLINCDKKVGPGGARTLGIQYATGEYVAFMDQDDWVEPYMYEHLYEKAVSYDCDVVESYNTRDLEYRYNEGTPQKTGKGDAFFQLNTPEDRKKYFAEERPEVRKYWAKIYRREFLLENDITFPQGLKYDDNFFKGMVFYHAKRIYVLEEYLYHWMVNNESISMKNDMTAHFDRMKVELLKLQEYERRGLLSTYREEMEYIFLEQFYANTFNTICTRNGTVSLEVLDYMRAKIGEFFPDYEKNPYIVSRSPVWAMGEWIENALRGIAQVRGKDVDVPQEILEKIAPLSFLDLVKTELTQEELNWYCSIYTAFDKVASRIDYSRLQRETQEQSGNCDREKINAVPQIKEYIWIQHGKAEILSESNMTRMLVHKGIEAACIGETYQDEISQEELLLDERYTQNGIVLEKSLLQEAGGINTRLSAKREYELILRVCELGKKVAIIPYQSQREGMFEAGCAGQEEIEENVADWEGFCTDAYVAGRYSRFLQERGLFETVIEALLAEGVSCGREKEAQHFLEEMISHTEKYYQYYDATQPILIYLGPTYCYNILNVFVQELARALKKQGQRVEFYDTEKEDVGGLAMLAGKRYKASIGFQTWLMSVKRKDKNEFFQDMIGGPKYNFIVDHPIWLHHQLREVPKRFYVLTHDRNYQTFIEKYYPKVEETYLLPPGGRGAFTEQAKENRRYDVTFLGTYGDYRKKLSVIRECVPRVKFLAAKYLFYMTKNPNMTAETAFGMALKHYNISLEQEEFLSLFGEMKAVIQCVMYYYREKTIETLLQAGLEIHVYGDSWKDSPFYENPYLHLHEEVQAEEAGAVLGESKISLNIMAWHKDGFTERIADSMLAGAVVVSDKSTQLEEYYGEEVVLFDLNHLEELPQKIKDLLEQPEKRIEIAQKAKEKALKCATWDNRAAELLGLIEKESERKQ